MKSWMILISLKCVFSLCKICFNVRFKKSKTSFLHHKKIKAIASFAQMMHFLAKKIKSVLFSKRELLSLIMCFRRVDNDVRSCTNLDQSDHILMYECFIRDDLVFNVMSNDNCTKYSEWCWFKTTHRIKDNIHVLFNMH